MKNSMKKLDMKMRLPILAAFFAFQVSCSVAEPDPNLPQAETAAPEAYAPLLEKYVRDDGVRYAAWYGNADDRKALEQVVDFYATTRPPEDRDTSLAWHLNAYNAWILQKILEKYPTEGPLHNEPTFFHLPGITLSGRKLSFDHLEQKLIRPVFEEPRIHFALNCASESCPPLHDRPFTAATLDADLEQLTRRFINHNPQGVAVKGRTVHLSKLLKWYAEDFGGEGNLVAYLNSYREAPLPANATVEFMEYSWKLNETTK